MIAYTTNTFGLRDKDMHYMHDLFIAFPAIDKVILYGSRARGNFRKGSDVDLAIVGANISFTDISRIHFLLENEGPTPLWFDVLHYDTLKNERLKHFIDQEGIVIYEKGRTASL